MLQAEEPQVEAGGVDGAGDPTQKTDGEDLGPGTPPPNTQETRFDTPSPMLPDNQLGLSQTPGLSPIQEVVETPAAPSPDLQPLKTPPANEGEPSPVAKQFAPPPLEGPPTNPKLAVPKQCVPPLALPKQSLAVPPLSDAAIDRRVRRCMQPDAQGHYKVCAEIREQWSAGGSPRKKVLKLFAECGNDTDRDCPKVVPSFFDLYIYNMFI